MENSQETCQWAKNYLLQKEVAYSIHSELGNITYHLSKSPGHKEGCEER